VFIEAFPHAAAVERFNAAFLLSVVGIAVKQITSRPDVPRPWTGRDKRLLAVGFNAPQQPRAE
jgi:hypothetical protein